MIFALLVAAALEFPAQVPPHSIPDPVKTPGAIDPVATVALVCTPHYTAKVRHVTTAMKRQVFSMYGITHDFGAYEVDHLISLEIGGANDVKNLWPQKYCPLDTGGKTCFGAREKDHVENYLHREVCAGRMTLTQAQTAIVYDWYAVYVIWKEKTEGE